MKTFFALLILLAPAISSAGFITHDFTVTGGTSGPLHGVSASGFFSYDADIVQPFQTVFASDLLTDFAFTWDGVVYDETNVRSASLGFDAHGELQSALFGTNCIPGVCTVFPRRDNFFLLMIGGFREFDYGLPGSRNLFAGPVKSLETRTAIPEPQVLIPFSLGVFGLVFMRRRRAA